MSNCPSLRTEGEVHGDDPTELTEVMIEHTSSAFFGYKWIDGSASQALSDCSTENVHP